jgi:Flp pilus assembly secretin CpaC
LLPIDPYNFAPGICNFFINWWANGRSGPIAAPSARVTRINVTSGTLICHSITVALTALVATDHRVFDHKDQSVMSTIVNSPLRGLSSPAATLLAGAALLGAMALDIRSAAAGAEDMVVKYDQSQLLRLPRPAAEIIIGNPNIADVAIQGGNLLVVTGKSFGITNIIILDAERNIIQDQRVMVERDVRKIVHLQKGATRESWNCSPQCNPTVTVGDDQKFFSQSLSNAASKIKSGEGAAEGSSANAQ